MARTRRRKKSCRMVGRGKRRRCQCGGKFAKRSRCSR